MRHLNLFFVEAIFEPPLTVKVIKEKLKKKYDENIYVLKDKLILD